MNTEEQKLRQLFKNNSDCYADTGRFENDGSYTEGEVIQAMTEDKFIEVLASLRVAESNTWVSVEDEMPEHEDVVYLCYVVHQPFSTGQTPPPTIEKVKTFRDKQGVICFNNAGTSKVTHWMPLPTHPTK